MASVPAAPVRMSSAAANQCPKCGAAIGADDVFCQGCGTKLK